MMSDTAHKRFHFLQGVTLPMEAFGGLVGEESERKVLATVSEINDGGVNAQPECTVKDSRR